MTGDEDKTAEKSGRGRTIQITTAVIAALATILVGYWQYGRSQDDSKHLGGSEKRFIGRVIDASTKSRIEGAKVSLDALGIPPVLYTDSEGVFTFPIPPNTIYFRVRIEASGYKEYDRRVDIGSIGEIEDMRLEHATPSTSEIPMAGSQVRLVDYSVSYPKGLDVLQPLLDIKLRNVGDKVAFLKRTEIKVLGSATFEDCNRAQHEEVKSSATYDLAINDDPPQKNISQSIAPNAVERFLIRIGQSEGGPELTVYKVKLRIVFNEDDEAVESEPFFLKVTGPNFIVGEYIHGVTKKEWDDCVQRNLIAFRAIGYKIYKDRD